MKWAGSVLAFLLVASTAHAQVHPTIADRDYGLDVYQGFVFGSGQIVGMGGASVAIAEGSAGMSSNPAAPATRSSTSNRKWDWDWHVDWLTPAVGTDFDNNGIDSERESTIADSPLFTLGAVLQYRQWAFGITGTSNRRTIPLGSDETATASLAAIRFQVARTLLDDQISAGAGLRIGQFDFVDMDNVALFSIGGASIEVGANYRPHAVNMRLGLSAALPFSGTDVSVDDCDPLDCAGYILPDRVEVPWRVAAGFAWRFANTRWNRKVKTPFRDESYWLVAGDVWVTGAVPDGYGVEAFTRMQLQPSGRSVAVSGRVGAEYEWLPGRLRIRFGSYWEPGRFLDPSGEGIPGRVHITAGLDVRVWGFKFWGKPYRLRISVTADGADKFGNGGVSAGFWH